MTNEQYIWSVMMKLIGNPYGVAGLLGNIQAESGMEPVCLETTYRKKLGMTSEEYTRKTDDGTYLSFVGDSAGYGLAQWTYWEHKKWLLELGQKENKSVGDLELQTEFLKQDMMRFSSVLHVLQRSTTVKEASNDVLLRYEKPADTSDKMKEKRAANGQKIFDRNVDPEWMEAFMNDRVKKTLEVAKSKLGCPYVFGARGPDKFDCRGYTYYCLEQAGITIDGAGATSQWNDDSNWAKKGTTDKMPDCLCCVFKRADDGVKMAHTGLHIGKGQIMHCSTGGVQYGTLDPGWTHWAIPIGLYKTEDIKKMEEVRAVRNLKRGCKGEDVTIVQNQLIMLGYLEGPADGAYGAKTIAAVKAFQADNGLTVDGVAGAMTQSLLNEKVKVKETPAIVISDDADGDLETVKVSKVELEAIINTINRWLGK